MKIVDNLSDKLFLGVSQIPGAGVGLYTGKEIPAGVPVCEYKGDVFEDTPEHQDLMYQRYNYTLTGGHKTRSMIYTIAHLPSGKTIDAHPYLCEEEVGIGSFANDAEDHVKRKARPENLTVEYWDKAGYNTYYWHVPNEVKIFLMSFRNIKAGEEILVDYGNAFWETMNIRDEELKNLKKKVNEEKLDETVKKALKNAEEKNE